MLSRREFLKLAALAGASIAVPSRLLGDAAPAFAALAPGATAPGRIARTTTALAAAVPVAPAFAQSGALLKFVQPLRDVGASGGIPLAVSDGTRTWSTLTGPITAAHYTIDIDEYTDQLHPNLPKATRLRGYGQSGSFTHLGGVIAAKRGEPVQITFRNKLPGSHILPVDNTIMGAEAGVPTNRTDVHLHGGFTPWISDGGPYAWWEPNGTPGPSFINNTVLNPGAAPGDAEYYYPNNQSARMMWYHDHTFGFTRLNAYAGVASGYVIYDDYELGLVAANNLPHPLGGRTHYLVFQDKIFVPSNIATADPTWPILMPNSPPGDLWYAHVYDPARWMLGPATLPLPATSCIPEFFGDTILVNGTVYPYLEVEQRQYRFRLLNACGARFLNPRLVYAQGPTPPASTEPSPNVAGPAFIQIGNEGGFLPAPAMLNGPKQPLLLLAPAERADLIVDFSAVPAGSTLILYNDAPAPFPMGAGLNDYYPKNPKTPTSIPGSGPNTRTLLQIRVKARVGTADPPITLPATFTPTDPFALTQTLGVPTPVPAGIIPRRLTLNETFDSYGRLIQMLGNDQPVTPVGAKAPLFGRGYMDPPTEKVAAGATEVWEIINLTADTHPMHFHLVNVQVLSRQALSVKQYVRGATAVGTIPNYQGPLIAPDANELGWKETVRCNPGEVTRLWMKFDLPGTPFVVPPSPRLLADYGITGGHEYVWHCHILEHEEHDMMRPLVVTP